MNPYAQNSALYDQYEHRFDRWKYKESEQLHIWHCRCTRCDIANWHTHDGKIVQVLEDGHLESEWGNATIVL